MFQNKRKLADRSGTRYDGAPQWQITKARGQSGSSMQQPQPWISKGDKILEWKTTWQQQVWRETNSQFVESVQRVFTQTMQTSVHFLQNCTFGTGYSKQTAQCSISIGKTILTLVVEGCSTLGAKNCKV